MLKRGISTVVATVLIVLITITAVVLLWAGISPLLNQILFVEDPNVDFIVDGGEYTVYDMDNGLISIRVTRGADDANIIAMRFVLTEEDGSTHQRKSYDVPAPNTAKVYTFDVSAYGKIVSVNVFAIYDFNGEEIESEANKNREEGFINGTITVVDPDVFGEIELNNLVINGDAESGLDEWNFDSLNTLDPYEGVQSFEQSGSKSVLSDEYFPIRPGTTYDLSAYMKQVQASPDSQIRFGFRSYDGSLRRIESENVYAYLNTETRLYSDVTPLDTTVDIYDLNDDGCADWVIHPSDTESLVFDIEDDYDDLPNFDLHTYENLVSVVDNGAFCTLTFDTSSGYPGGNYLAETRVRQHYHSLDNSYFVLSGTIDTTWTRYSGTISEECAGSQASCTPNEFWKGTENVRIVLITNYLQTGSEITLVDNITLIEHTVL